MEQARTTTGSALDQMTTEARMIAAGGSLDAVLRIAREWPDEPDDGIAQKIVADYRKDAIEALSGVALVMADAARIGPCVKDTELYAAQVACGCATARISRYFRMLDAARSAGVIVGG